MKRALNSSKVFTPNSSNKPSAKRFGDLDFRYRYMSGFKGESLPITAPRGRARSGYWAATWAARNSRGGRRMVEMAAQLRQLAILNFTASVSKPGIRARVSTIGWALNANCKSISGLEPGGPKIRLSISRAGPTRAATRATQPGDSRSTGVKRAG